MRRTIAEIAAAVAAGAIIYGVFEYAKPFSFAARIAVAAGVTVAGLTIAWLVRRRDRDSMLGTIRVGDKLKARRDISLEDVDVAADDGSNDVSVGTRWKSGGDARITGVRVTRKRDRE